MQMMGIWLQLKIESCAYTLHNRPTKSWGGGGGSTASFAYNGCRYKIGPSFNFFGTGLICIWNEFWHFRRETVGPVFFGDGCTLSHHWAYWRILCQENSSFVLGQFRPSEGEGGGAVVLWLAAEVRGGVGGSPHSQVAVDPPQHSVFSFSMKRSPLIRRL